MWGWMLTLFWIMSPEKLMEHLNLCLGDHCGHVRNIKNLWEQNRSIPLLWASVFSLCHFKHCYCHGNLALSGADPPSTSSVFPAPPSVVCVCGREHQLRVLSQKQVWLPQFLLHTWPSSTTVFKGEQLIPSSKDVHRTQSCRPRRQNLINILPCCTKLSAANYVGS